MIIHAAGLDPEGVEVDFPLERSGPVSGQNEPFLVRSAVLSGRVLPRQGGLSFLGRISGQVDVECARCLTSYGLQVEREFDLFFAFTQVKGKEVQIPDDALDYAFLHEGDGIDLEQVATEQIYLEIPMKPLCLTSCRGLCARCGANLNEGECRCMGASPIS